MKNRPRLNRYERRAMHEEKMRINLQGQGRYIYQNNTDGDLRLPKPAEEGITIIGPRQKFVGDSYFMELVKYPMNMLRVVEVIEDGLNKKEEVKMNQEKLILDQPDTVTTKGTVERVVVQPDQQVITDGTESQEKPKDVLLNEDPIDSVEIILG